MSEHRHEFDPVVRRRDDTEQMFECACGERVTLAAIADQRETPTRECDACNGTGIVGPGNRPCDWCSGGAA
jgi:hypothetical protein